jgi:hypothetical protein
MYVVAAGFASQETTLSRVRARPDLVVLFSTIPQFFSSLGGRSEWNVSFLIALPDESWLSYWAIFLLAG